ncbi:MAG: hypothetical protein ACE5NN_02730 [Candidatus Bathyarchaeia archaeon]
MERAVRPQSYILRITKEEWFRQVFTIKKYYPGVRRRWEPNATILLVRNSEKGDSFVGYGTLKEYLKRDVLPEDERRECELMRWTGALVFSELFKFEPPLLLKETVLSGTTVRGRYLHGYPLTHREVDSILNRAKELSTIRKIV